MSQQVANETYRVLTAALQENGLKLTTPRRHLLRALVSIGKPCTADEVIAQLTARGHVVHRATVYRDLVLFVHHGLLQELIILGTPAHYYEILRDDHHHHFVCTKCHQILDVYPENVERAIKRFETELDGRGLVVETHQLKFYGTCADCSAQIINNNS